MASRKAFPAHAHWHTSLNFPAPSSIVGIILFKKKKSVFGRQETASHFNIHFLLVRENPSADTHWQFLSLSLIACYFCGRGVLPFPWWLIRGLHRVLLANPPTRLATVFHSRVSSWMEAWPLTPPGTQCCSVLPLDLNSFKRVDCAHGFTSLTLIF